MVIYVLARPGSRERPAHDKSVIMCSREAVLRFPVYARARPRFASRYFLLARDALYFQVKAALQQVIILCHSSMFLQIVRKNICVLLANVAKNEKKT